MAKRGGRSSGQSGEHLPLKGGSDPGGRSPDTEGGSASVAPKPAELPDDKDIGLGWLLKVLSKSIEHVPYVRYAFGLVGIAAAAALILLIFRFIADRLLGSATLTPIFLMMGLMIVLMFVLFLFAKISDENKRFLELPAKLVAWLSVAILIVLIGVATMVGLLQQPKHLAEMVFGRVATPAQKELRDTFKRRRVYARYCADLAREGDHEYIEDCINFSVKDFFVECSAETPNVPDGEEFTPDPFACLDHHQDFGALEPPAAPLPARWAIGGEAATPGLFHLASADPPCDQTLLGQLIAQGKLPDGFQIKGIDISHHSKGIPWDQLIKEGNVFVVMKATEGTGFTDPDFMENWRLAGELGLLRGAYHVMRYDKSPALQFKQFAKVLAAAGPRGCDFGAALDVKSAARGKPDPAEAANKIGTWLGLAQETFHKRPLLFTSPFFLENILQNPDRQLHDAMLWLSDYSPVPPVLPAGSWLSNFLWQFSDGEQNVPEGYRGPPVDRSVFIGNAKDFGEILGLRFER